MHYANGRAARAGDIVRGTGYNVKYEIVGRLIFANPEVSACNCQVAHVGVNSQVLHNAFPKEGAYADGSIGFIGFDPGSFHGVQAQVEYGQLDAFVALNPLNGEVLPAEE